MFQVTPLTLISQGYALPASPEGKLLYRALGCWALPERPFLNNCQLSIVNCQLKTPKTGFLMRFRQSEADGNGVVYHGHLLVVEPAHVFSQAAFVDGADLFQEDHGVLG